MRDKTIKWWMAALLLAATTAGPLEAYELNPGTNLPPVDFHGFVSQGFLYSSDNNYLGNSSHGSFKFTEAGLNASFNPLPRTRIAAQGFTYDVGDAGGYDLVLDYALAEYTFNDYFGVRAGRVRLPAGIYKDIQDVDMARTFVLLPQGIYDARFRDFSLSLDGGEFFGTLPLRQAGSLSYEIYAGMINPDDNGGHGFTTKKDGHGFGLHSGALATREMGGSLTVHSDGSGKGASFTLEIPLPPQPVSGATMRHKS